MGRSFGHTPSRRIVKRHIHSSREEEEELRRWQGVEESPVVEETTPTDSTPEASTPEAGTTELSVAVNGGVGEDQHIYSPTRALCK
ncbi:hypothetical protein Hamer_G021149 [Homarus americanus]|uniref:Uncharacterized protein n=1 Tax=Homarus americanus TaxID=6706 RepID=A0A8J5NBH4_HOMAM|nr:hypothetical protein Hamer_G021149 [Homarus americanus]